nr:hypothetical protein [uncultured Clostridium sp.]
MQRGKYYRDCLPVRKPYCCLKAVRGERNVLRAWIKGILWYKQALKREPLITEKVAGVAEQTDVHMAGTEYRIKSVSSYLKKFCRKYSQTGRACEIKDILRYTYTVSPELLSEKVLKIIEIYKDSGYNTVEIKNYWLDSQNPYNGINTILRSPGGQAFELQYHTPESFGVKSGKIHELYEKQRLMKDVSSREYIELGDQMFELSDSMEIPEGIEKVKCHG